MINKILNINGREILDSRGNPTIEVTCSLLGGVEGIFSVPSGASTGIHEAIELRDGDINRYNGLGVLKAVKNINEVIKNIIKDKEFDQESLDKTLIKLDATENKSKLGANAILGVSLSFAKASAITKKQELYKYIGEMFGNNNYHLPIPSFNLINGGKHSDSGLDIQEFMILPTQIDTIKEKIRVGAEVFHTLKKILQEKNYSTGVGDEGGFAPKLSSNEEAFKLLMEAINKSGYEGKIKLGVDIASSSFYKNGKYNFKINGKEKNTDSKELISWYEELAKDYPIILIEDGLSEDDWDGFKNMNNAMGKDIKIVGDDLTVTNKKRIEKAINEKAINSVIIKPNQIGTLTETLEAVKIAQKAGFSIMVSHRSGDTPDSFIADLAVGIGAEFIKSGSLSRGERISKYNRLLEIEEKI
ncbi:MAG: phosphopyruvate hydratase [Candidatus Paceibacterota bacterium]|jgi:enolase